MILMVLETWSFNDILVYDKLFESYRKYALLIVMRALSNKKYQSVTNVQVYTFRWLKHGQHKVK